MSPVETEHGLTDGLADDPLEAVIAIVHEASLDSRKWLEVAHALSDFLGGHTVSVRLQMPEPVARTEVYHSDAPKVPDSVFQEIWRAGLPWGNAIATEGALADVRARFVDHQDEVLGVSLTETRIYREWMAPRGLAALAPIVHVFAGVDDVALSAVTIYNKAGLPPITRDQVEDLDRLVPHLGIAHEALDTLRSLDHERAVFSELIDRLPSGIILIDEHGMISEMNESARIVVSEADGLNVESGRLVPASPECAAWLDGMLERARSAEARGRHRPDGGATQRAAWNAGVPLIVSPLQLPAADASLPDIVAVVFVGNPQLSQDVAMSAIRNLYQLTHAEAELTWLLAEGLSLEQAAAARGVTLNTARSQLKRVFAKTGSNRQADLVRLVLGGVAALRAKG